MNPAPGDPTSWSRRCVRRSTSDPTALRAASTPPSNSERSLGAAKPPRRSAGRIQPDRWRRRRSASRSSARAHHAVDHSCVGAAQPWLATTRGWKPETAERTTRTWAAALGFDELAAETWPLVPATGARPTASIEPAAGATALPPAQPAGIGDDISIRGAVPVWPPPAKRLSLAHAESESGRPVLGVVQAYAGVSLTAFTGVISLLTVALVAVLLLLPGSGWLLVLVGVGAATYATRFLQYGALLATEIGIEFVPYDGNMRRARPERSMHATWDEVAVMLGKVSSVSAGGRRFQVGPRNKAFALASSGPGGIIRRGDTMTSPLKGPRRRAEVDARAEYKSDASPGRDLLFGAVRGDGPPRSFGLVAQSPEVGNGGMGDDLGHHIFVGVIAQELMPRMRVPAFSTSTRCPKPIRTGVGISRRHAQQGRIGTPSSVRFSLPQTQTTTPSSRRERCERQSPSRTRCEGLTRPTVKARTKSSRRYAG